MDMALGYTIALRATTMGVGYAIGLSLLGFCDGVWWATALGITSAILRILNGRNLANWIAAGAQLLILREVVAVLSLSKLSWEVFGQAPCMTILLLAGTIHMIREQKQLLLKITTCWPMLLLLSKLVDSTAVSISCFLCSPAVIFPILVCSGNVLATSAEEITGVIVVSLLASSGNFPQAVILLIVLLDVSWVSHQVLIRRQPPKSCLAASQSPANVKVTFDMNTDFTASKHKIGPPRKKPAAKRPHLVGFNKALSGRPAMHHLGRLY
eukprot:TRINITY_DN7308_c1_g1_i2.p1 TRINITY_DN7308_c1_g1~~TRINITY_DN7308_c1_g1_i2.p1  ORF type:complete len:285 (+),score=17.49 TRINITY_DN7308_c1_g1_i2:54-857(+)